VGEDTNRIEQEIREVRAGLGRNLDELQDKARDLADWRTHYRGHTGTFLGVALGAGFLLALATVPARRLSHRDAALRDATHDPNYVDALRRYNQSQDQGTVARATRQLGHTWDEITDGLVRTASAKALQVVAEIVPGFADQVASHSTPSGTRLH
jgi:hypothetical protein